MIFFDTTKAAVAAHRSGLVRVSERLRAELGTAAQAVRWPELPSWFGAGDWFVTAELFSERERPGFGEFLARRACRTSAIFHDAVPLKLPHITWPQSVARHPGYMKQLARFDRVFAVSEESKRELEGFWRWQGISAPPPVGVLSLGADFSGEPRVHSPAARTAGMVRLLCVGILEPRKNQALLLEACAQLWDEGLTFELHLVGRVNPHFGKPVVRRIRELTRRFPGRLEWHEGLDDRGLASLYRDATASVFPTIAEGCGLPLLESLWFGVPCLCSDLPVLRENGRGGGCRLVQVNDVSAWTSALRELVENGAAVEELRRQATTRSLPTWAQAAGEMLDGLKS